MALRLVGKIKDAHGLKGELYVFIYSGEVNWLPRLKEFGLGLPGRIGESLGEESVTHRMTTAMAKPFKDGLILKAAEINDRTAAEGVKGKGFYVPEEFFVSEPGETIYLNEIMGFTVKDPAQTKLGEITGFSSNGPQDLLVVKTATGTAEIPFVDAFLRKIDFEKKSVVMELPEGLLSVSEREEAE